MLANASLAAEVGKQLKLNQKQNWGNPIMGADTGGDGGTRPSRQKVEGGRPPKIVTFIVENYEWFHMLYTFILVSSVNAHFSQRRKIIGNTLALLWLHFASKINLSVFHFRV